MVTALVIIVYVLAGTLTYQASNYYLYKETWNVHRDITGALSWFLGLFWPLAPIFVALLGAQMMKGDR